MKKVLITGVGGLLGGALAKNLSQNLGIHVIGVTSNPKIKKDHKIEYIILDFSKEWSYDLLPKDVDVIIHLAQSSHFRDFPGMAMDVFKVNVESTARLLDFASKSGVKQFIYTSSGGVYGNGSSPFKESDPIVPFNKLGNYLGSKACGEILVQSYASIFNVIVFRPFFMYGPGQNRNMLIPRLMDSILLGKPIILLRENGIRINPIYIQDACKAIEASIFLKVTDAFNIFNIAGPEILSLRNICNEMGRFLNTKPFFHNEPDGPGDLIGDISLLKSKLIYPKTLLFDKLHEIAK